MDRPTSFRLTRSNPMEIWLIGCLMVIYGGLGALLCGGEGWPAILGTPVFAVGVAICLLMCAKYLRNRLSFPLQITAGLIATTAGLWQAATGGDLMAMGRPGGNNAWQVASAVGVGLAIAGLLGCVLAVHLHNRAQERATEQIGDPASAD
jgi:hypothetical protein